MKIRDAVRAPHRRIEGLGGLFRDRPWYLSERNLIAEVEKPITTRAWDFFVRIGAGAVPLIVAIRGGRKQLTTPGETGVGKARGIAAPPAGLRGALRLSCSLFPTDRARPMIAGWRSPPRGSSAALRGETAPESPGPPSPA